MRKLFYALIAFAFLSISISSSAQVWIDVGLKGSWGPNFLINKNYFDDDNLKYRFSWGYSMGGKIGINFKEKVGITIDALYTGQEHQFEYETGALESIYKRSLDYKAVDLMLLVRSLSAGNYVEFGPSYTRVLSGSGVDTNPDSGQHGTNDVTPYLNKNLYGLVFGIGGNLMGSERFNVTIGLRFKYTFSDLISEEGQKVNYISGTPYDKYKSTNPISGMIVLEMNYALGYWAKSTCTKRKRFVTFKK